MLPAPATAMQSTVIQATPGGGGGGVFVAGAAAFAVGTVYFLVVAVRDDGLVRSLAGIHAAVTAIAMAAYGGMVIGIGVGSVSMPLVGDAAVNWARYLDWALTTPLLLYSLLQFVDVDRRTLAALVAMDLGMVGAGFLATVAVEQGLLGAIVRVYGLVFVALGLWMAILYTLFMTADEPSTSAGYATLRNALTGLWSLYPFVWIVAAAGLAPALATGAAFLALDVLTKFAYGVLTVRYARGESPVPEPTGGAAPAESGAS